MTSDGHNSCGALPPGVGDDDPHFTMPGVDDEPVDPELEEALANTEGELVSVPPPDVEPMPCQAHGSPFVKVTTKTDEEGEPVGTWKVYEDGCEEPL